MDRRKLIYPGKAREKDRVRQGLYNACANVWYGDRPVGDAIVLCGNEPLDGPELFALGFPHDACWFVDNRLEGGLAEAKRRWPSTNVVLGEVKSLIQYRRPLALINLDLMEQLSDKAEELIGLAGEALMTRGILALTFVRARERVGTSARRALDRTGAADLNAARMRRVGDVLRPMGEYSVIFYEQYQAHSIAMSTVAVIKR